MIIDNLIELNTIEKAGLTAEKSHVLNGKLYVGKAGVVETGTMPNIGAVNVTLAAGESYKPTLGYHNGQGTITAKTLAEQTTATAQAAHILAPYTAWVTGGKVTGTMVNRTGWTSSVTMNSSVVIPQGYHDGTKSVTGPTITNRGAWTGSVAMNSSVTIPEGYHNGGGKVNGPSITRMDGFTITPTDQAQTFQTANKYMNGNISCLAMSVLPPEVVKKGYSYKVGNTTYVGTFEGYVPGALDVYNRGSFGSGYSLSSFVMSPVQGYAGGDLGGPCNASIVAQGSSLKLTSVRYMYDHGWSVHQICYLNKLVDLSAYNSISVTVSNVWSNRNSPPYSLAVGSSPGKTDIASTQLLISSESTELTTTLDVSALKSSGYIWFDVMYASGDKDTENYTLTPESIIYLYNFSFT